MAMKGFVALLVLIAGSSVMSAETNTTVSVSTLDDSANAHNATSTTVKPTTSLSPSTEMDASTSSQPITEGTTSKMTTNIPESATTNAPPHTRHFDGLSFLGGILLTAGAAGLLLGGYKYFGPGRGDKGAYNRIGMKDLYGESDHLPV